MAMPIRIITIIAIIIVGINIKYSQGQTDPTNIVCSALNSTTLRLTWTEASDTSVLGYYLECVRVDGLKIEPAIPMVDLNSRAYATYDFHGLGKYGTYNITINSYASASNYSEYITTCTTSEDVPDGSSTYLACTATTAFSITCTWNSLSQVYWNGAQLGYRLQWLSTNVSEMFSTTVSSNITTATARALKPETTYFLILNAYTSVGHGTMYTTDSATTLGITSKKISENVTSYYCYEAFPGYIEFGWKEMPCTIYTGTIGGLLVLCGLFISIFACQACCGKGSSGTDLNLNVFNPSNRKPSEPDESDNDTDDEMDDDRGEKEDILEDEVENEYDNEGYENDGYRSKSVNDDEDSDSNMPDEDGRSTVNSLKGLSGRITDNPPKEGNTARKTLPKTRKAESLPVSEDDADVIDADHIADSDYDTQSDNDENEIIQGLEKSYAPAVVKLSANAKLKHPNEQSGDNKTEFCFDAKETKKFDSFSKVTVRSAQATAIADDKGTRNNAVNFKTTATVHEKEKGTLPSRLSTEYLNQVVDNDVETDEWGSPVPKTSNKEIRSQSQSSVELNNFRAPSEVSFQIGSPVNDWDDSDGWGGVFLGKHNGAKPTGRAMKQDAKNNDWDDLVNNEDNSRFKEFKSPALDAKQMFSTIPIIDGQRHKEAGNVKTKVTIETEMKNMNKNDYKTSNLMPVSIQHQGYNSTSTITQNTDNRSGHTMNNQGSSVTNASRVKSGGKISFRDQQRKPSLPNGGTARKTSTTVEHKNRVFIENEVDDVVVLNEQPKKLEENGKMISTKAWLHHSHSSPSFQRSGRKTPVKSLPKTQSWTAIEIEPVLGTDRLSKKFPFLSLNNISNETGQSGSQKQSRKNKSDNEIIEVDNSAKAKESNFGKLLMKNVSPKDDSNKDTKGKIFYGFGIGKFRYFAAAWVAKFRFKKGLVKTVDSDWK